MRSVTSSTNSGLVFIVFFFLCNIFILTLFQAQLIGQILQPFNFFHQVSCGQTSQLCDSNKRAALLKGKKTALNKQMMIKYYYKIRSIVLRCVRVCTCTRPFNISMSSDSNSAIHLGGEIVIGWGKKTDKMILILGHTI